MDVENREPHNYRVLLEAFPDFTIVGGQAVSVWALAYLKPEDLQAESGYGSHDLDVYARRKAAEITAALPDWNSERPPLWSFDRRLLRLTSKDEAGQVLIVEVLGKVNGLDDRDLQAVREILAGGIKYRVLDPIAMLKAKAANVRDINQEGRHDRAHLRLIARCVAPYLLEGHQQAIASAETQKDFADTVSRIFKTVSDKRTLRTLLAEGIIPHELIPDDLGTSPIEKVRRTFQHQMPRLREHIGRIAATA
jgi:hypothetical protein